MIWIMVGCQLAAWAWFMWHGGNLPSKKFYLYSAGMMLGQIGASFDTFQAQAWPTFTVQVYFLAWTGFGAYKRYRDTKKSTLS